MDMENRRDKIARDTTKAVVDVFIEEGNLSAVISVVPIIAAALDEYAKVLRMELLQDSIRAEDEEEDEDV